MKALLHETWFIDYEKINTNITVDEKIFCCHGGLSPDLQSMEQIRRIMRPTDVPDQGLLCDLLWSDPDKDTMGWGENDRGVSFTFGAEVSAIVNWNFKVACKWLMTKKIFADCWKIPAEAWLWLDLSGPSGRGRWLWVLCQATTGDTVLSTQLLWRVR